MEIRTFTNFWNMERKLYAIEDISLPVPISLKVVGAFFITGIPWWGILALLNVPFSNPGYLAWVLPPIALGYIASRPIYQRKSIGQFVKSMASFYLQPKRLAGLRTPTYDINATYRILTKVFTRKPLSKKEM
jgi:hypothetical protein